MNHIGGHDHSQDARIRCCDACTRPCGWAVLTEVFDPATGDPGYWVCAPCLRSFPRLKLVPASAG